MYKCKECFLQVCFLFLLLLDFPKGQLSDVLFQVGQFFSDLVNAAAALWVCQVDSGTLKASVIQIYGNADADEQRIPTSVLFPSCSQPML